MELLEACNSSSSVCWESSKAAKIDENWRSDSPIISENGAYPSTLGYGGFSKSVCPSVNECICHGILGSHVLEGGDIINIDDTVYLNGCYGNTLAISLVERLMTMPKFGRGDQGVPSHQRRWRELGDFCFRI